MEVGNGSSANVKEDRRKAFRASKNLEVADGITAARARKIKLCGQMNHGDFTKCMTQKEKNYMTYRLQGAFGPNSIEEILDISIRQLDQSPKFKKGDFVEVRTILSKIIICKGRISGYSPGVGYTVEQADGSKILTHEAQLNKQPALANKKACKIMQKAKSIICSTIFFVFSLNIPSNSIS